MDYVRPDESIIGAAVSGTVSTDYLESWLTDGMAGRPARTDGAMSLTVTPAAALNVDTVAVISHNIEEAATITLGGSLSGSIATQPWLANGMPANWYARLTSPVATSSIVLGVTGNSGATIVGELYAGFTRTLPSLRIGRRLSPGKTFPWEGEYSSLAPYDTGIGETLRVTGSIVVNEQEMNEVDAWFLSQRNGSLPTLILPDYPANVAWLCAFNYEADDLAPGEPLVDGSPTPHVPFALFEVSMEIVVIPPLRW